MIKYTNDDKTLVVPKNLGNFPSSETIVTSGITEEECQEMIDASLVDYATTATTGDLQSQINDKQDALEPGEGIKIENGVISCTVTGGTSGSTVQWEQLVTAGTKIAEVTVDGTTQDVYAPEGGAGTQGPTGPQGPQGEKGDPFRYEDFTPQQLEGLRGPQGFQGAEGPQGQQGPEGPQGPTGKAFEYSDFTPEQLASLVGPQGPQGAQGPTGETGPAGPTGPTGETGPTGPAGTYTAGAGIDITNGVITCTVSGGTDGYVYTTFDDYDAMTQEEKEAWYDAIKADVLNGNCKYGLIQQYDYAVPGDYGNSQVKYRVYLFNELEDGYPSLHYSGAEFSGDNGSYRAWNARITRGGSIETWNRGVDMSKFTENENDRRMFTITTGLTAYGYFDCYMFNRCFSEPHQSWDFYSAVGSMPLRIVSPHQDNPDEYDLVCTANILACGEAPSGLYQDGYAKRFVFRYFLNGDLWEAVMDSVSGGSGDGLHLIHNYEVYGTWAGTQAQYNAIGSGNYDSKVIYHIDR